MVKDTPIMWDSLVPSSYTQSKTGKGQVRKYNTPKNSKMDNKHMEACKELKKLTVSG